jgi:hypothetical protein
MQLSLAAAARGQGHRTAQESQPVPLTRLPGVDALKPAARARAAAQLPTLFPSVSAPGRAVQAAAKKPKPYFGLAWDPTEPVRPPDCAIAKSPTHILQVVNSRLTVLDAKGRTVFNDGAGGNFLRLGSLFSPVTGTEDVTWFGPRCVYDVDSQRFFVMVAGADFGEKDEAWMGLAVSAGSDPLAGEWTVYGLRTDFDGPTQLARWADCLDFGVDGSFLVASWNEQQFDNNAFVRSRLRVFSKASLLAAETPNPVDFARLQDTNGDLSFAVRPCRHYGANSAFYLVNSKPLGGDSLELWRVTGTPADPQLDSVTVPGIINYAVPPDARQPGVPTAVAEGALDTGDARVLSAIADGGRVWTTLNTSLDGLPPDSAIHVAELNAGTGAVIQSRAIGARGTDYYYAAVDSTSGTRPGIAVVFGSSSPRLAAGLRYFTRNSTMPLGQFRPSKTLINGNGRYDPLAPRDPLHPKGPVAWGRYFGAVRDVAKPTQVLLGGAFANATKAKDPKGWATKLLYVKP